jgi:hypothetical protein
MGGFVRWLLDGLDLLMSTIFCSGVSLMYSLNFSIPIIPRITTSDI